MPKATNLPSKPALGLKVKDIVTGFTGIVCAKYEFLNSCVRFNVEGKTGKDGKEISHTFDSQRLEVVGWGVVEPPKKHRAARTGGDGPEPQRRNEP